MSEIIANASVPDTQREAPSVHRLSIVSDISESSEDERDYYDDQDSIMQHGNDSQSSLDDGLEDMELDSEDYEERCRQSPISRLPAELLIAVFSKISSTADFKSCMLVSKGWARCSVDLLWHRPATGTWKSLMNVMQTTRKTDGFFAYHDLVKRLNLSQLKEQISDGTLVALANCKRIERLTLTDCTKLTDLSVSQLIDGNRNLLAIDVSGLDGITDRTMTTVANNCYKLQGLNITKCTRVTDVSLVAVAQNCRRVKRLKLNECPQLTDQSVLAFADNCHDILEIDLHGCVNINDVSVTALLSESRQLRELRLAQCFRLTDESFLQLPSEHLYENLRVLDLTDCNALTDAGLSKIVNSAPRLRNLVLAKCRNVTDRGVLSITRLGKNLHYIHLGHCSRITDHGVSNLVKFCTRIRYIDLACCTNLTDSSISLLAGLQKLKRIGLVKCAAITDYSLQALALPKQVLGSSGSWPNMLERLHLSYCNQLTVPGIRSMLINCPRLTHLSLTGVPDFLRQDLVDFCRPPPQEFNPHQRDVFCVFSGPGVAKLRKHLAENYAPQGSELSMRDDSDDEGMHDFDATSAQLFQQGHQPHHAYFMGAHHHPQSHQAQAHHMAQQLQFALQQQQNQQQAHLNHGHTHIQGVHQYQQHLHTLQYLQQQQHHTSQQHFLQQLPAALGGPNQPSTPDPQEGPSTPNNNQSMALPGVATPYMTPDGFATAHLHAHPFTPRPLSANPMHNPFGTPAHGNSARGTPAPGTPALQAQIPFAAGPSTHMHGLGIQQPIQPLPPLQYGGPVGNGDMVMGLDDDDEDDEDVVEDRSRRGVGAE